MSVKSLHPKKESIIQSDLHRESIKGILANKNFVISGLQVSTASGLNVNISQGSCIVGGVYIEFYNSALTLPANSTSEVYVELILDGNKPTNATITFGSSFTYPTDTRLWLATVVTSSNAISSITDRRIYRVSGTRTVYTSSGNRYLYNTWIFTIMAGGGGGGRSSVASGSNATGGAGGDVTVENIFHHSGTLTWTVGSGGGAGNPANQGGNSSITYRSTPTGTITTIYANGGLGAIESSSLPLSIGSTLNYFGTPIIFPIQIYSNPSNMNIYSPIISSSQAIYSTSFTTIKYVGGYASLVGSPYITTSNTTSRDNSVQDSSTGQLSRGGDSSSGSGTSGTAGRIILYTWEI